MLLHGIGMSRRVWEPVIPALAARFDVIAVDLPGFGDSPLLAGGAGDPAALARAVGGLLDELAVRAPRLAGNSLGGWVALELAAQREVTSVALISPAGLWRDDTPRYCRVSLRASRWLSRRVARVLNVAVGWRLGRIIVLGQTHGRPWALTPQQARQTLRDMGECPGFEATMTATSRARYAPSEPIACPVTVAFGSRDWLLRPRHSRHVEQLPATSTVTALPGCGHVPIADDPPAVAAFIATAASASVSARPPTPDVAQSPDRPRSRSSR